MVFVLTHMLPYVCITNFQVLSMLFKLRIKSI